MERETFEDQEAADVLNANFVSIKVDREERPDIDAVYMAVCQALTGSGGWPLSVFLTLARMTGRADLEEKAAKIGQSFKRRLSAQQSNLIQGRRECFGS
jgi:uncharacterized protein YyaL (SSP411 family)